VSHFHGHGFQKHVKQQGLINTMFQKNMSNEYLEVSSTINTFIDLHKKQNSQIMQFGKKSLAKEILHT
jgi:hypothetical protein